MSLRLCLLVLMLIVSAKKVRAEPAICNDSVDYACTALPPSSQNNYGRIIAQKAVNQTVQFLNEKPASVRGFANSLVRQLESKDAALWNQAFNRGVLYISCMDYLSRVYYSSGANLKFESARCFDSKLVSPKNMLGALEKLQDMRSQAKVRQMFSTAKKIVQQVLTQSFYNSSLKEYLGIQVSNTHAISMAEYAVQSYLSMIHAVQADPSQVNAAPQAILNILGRCDFDGVQPNAFNQMVVMSTEKGPLAINQMVVCPSFWALATDSATKLVRPPSYEGMTVKDNTDIRLPTVEIPLVKGDEPQMMFLILHEFGHTIDTALVGLQAVIPDARSDYGFFTGCMARKLERNGTFLNPPLKSLNNRHLLTDELLTKLYFNEYHADSIAANGFSIYLKRFDSSLRPEIARKGMNALCGSKADVFSLDAIALHPVGEDRIEKIFMGNAHLRKALGCTSKPKAYSCSFM